MAGYVVAEIIVHNPDLYEQYRRGVPSTLDRYGGKFVVRGGTPQSLEGGWTPERIVILEFPSIERAREWYTSPEYLPLRAMRQQSTTSRMVFVQGV